MKRRIHFSLMSILYLILLIVYKLTWCSKWLKTKVSGSSLGGPWAICRKSNVLYCTYWKSNKYTYNFISHIIMMMMMMIKICLFQAEQKHNETVTTNAAIACSHRESSGETHLCRTCGKTFARARYLTSHMRTHSRRADYIRCSKCPRMFTSERTLKVTTELFWEWGAGCFLSYHKWCFCWGH